MTIAILLVVAALAVLMLEVFFVSFGALALVATTLAVLGVVRGFAVSPAAGWSLLGALVVGTPLTLRLAFAVLPRLPFGRGFQLTPPPPAAPEPPSPLLGAVGEAVSTLRPSGRALIDGAPVTVVARGPMVRPGTRVRVVEVNGTRVVVEADGDPT